MPYSDTEENPPPPDADERERLARAQEQADLLRALLRTARELEVEDDMAGDDDNNQPDDQHQEDDDDKEVEITGGQLNATRTYDGTTDIEIYISHINRNVAQFQWNNQQTAAVVKNKLTGTAAQWLRGQELMGTDLNTWEDLAVHLRGRFLAEYNELAASKAIRNLKQRDDEKVNDFFDRVLDAVDKKNHGYSPLAKSKQTYKEHFMRDVFVFFSAGLKEDIRLRATGGTIITEADELLTAANNVEREMTENKIPKLPAIEVSSVEDEKKTDPKDPKEENPLTLEALGAQIDALQAQFKRKDEKGAQEKPGQNQEGRNNPPFRGRGRGGGFRARNFGGRGRGFGFNRGGQGFRRQNGNGPRWMNFGMQVTCFACGNIGHYAFNCPAVNRGPRANPPQNAQVNAFFPEIEWQQNQNLNY